MRLFLPFALALPLWLSSSFLSTSAAWADACVIEDKDAVLETACSDFARPEGGLAKAPPVQEVARGCHAYHDSILAALSHHCQYKNKMAALQERAQAAAAAVGVGDSNRSQLTVSAIYNEMRSVDSRYAAQAEVDINNLSNRHSNYLGQLRWLVQHATRNLALERNCEIMPTPALEPSGFLLLSLATKAGPESWDSFQELSARLGQESHQALARSRIVTAMQEQTLASGTQAGTVASAPAENLPLPLMDAGKPPLEVISPLYIGKRGASTFTIGFTTLKLVGAPLHRAIGHHSGLWGTIAVKQNEAAVEFGLKGFMFQSVDWGTFVTVGVSLSGGPVAAALTAVTYYTVIQAIQATQAYKAYAIPQLQANPSLTAKQLQTGYCQRLAAGLATTGTAHH